MSRKRSELGAAMLQPGRQAQAAGNISVMPAAEMPMVLTLDQLSPNPDNPRTSRNPRYDDIKASIRSRGLDTVPKVTRDPDGEPDVYIFSDGGNTRYQILSVLWQETGEDRFFRVHVLFKPWPGRLQCVIGHLAENEVRGDPGRDHIRADGCQPGGVNTTGGLRTAKPAAAGRSVGTQCRRLSAVSAADEGPPRYPVAGPRSAFHPGY